MLGATYSEGGRGEGSISNVSQCRAQEVAGCCTGAHYIGTMGAMELRRVGSRFLRLYLLYLLGYNIMHCTISTVSTVSTVSTISTVSSRNYEDNETSAPVVTLIPTLQLERKGWAKR